jgi:hypothetical protein
MRFLIGLYNIFFIIPIQQKLRILIILFSWYVYICYARAPYNYIDVSIGLIPVFVIWVHGGRD